MMIERNLTPALLERAATFSVVTLSGPRQSGKTTLCRLAFPHHRRVTLESPDVREFASSDPRGFLASLPDGAVLDEVQRCPGLLSFLQEDVDERPVPGRWILTGSHNLLLMQAVTQTLAGRTAILNLLPFSIGEMAQLAGEPPSWFDAAWRGGYPAPADRGHDQAAWLAAYVASYVERDVRQVIQIADLTTFQSFLRLCAGRAGQLLNLSQLGADVGVSHVTIKAWLSVLETTFVAFRLQPWFANLGKREVKTPKLYFWDTGLLCWLLGVRAAEELVTHPLRGAVFENLMAVELMKEALHKGQTPNWFFYRDHAGLEVDFIRPGPAPTVAIEVKSAATIASEFLAPLHRMAEMVAAGGGQLRAAVVYGGHERQVRTGGEVLGWRGVERWAGER
jgi:predicted AAA+ superfamily ATPase